MSGRNPPSYCTLTLIAMQGHQQKGRQNNTSSNNKDKSNTIIETSTAEDHDDENLNNPSTRPRYSPESRRRAVGDHTRREEASGKNWVPRSITCQGYDTQMLLMHGLSYGPALTRNTKERSSVNQSDKVGLRPTRVTSHTIPPKKVFNSRMSLQHVFYSELSCRNWKYHQLHSVDRSSNLLASSCRAGL